MIESLFSGINYLATKKLLDVATVRHHALAGNLANVETPGFKRVDLPKEFQAELRNSIERGDRGGLAKLQPSTVVDGTASSTRADGNTVQIDKELLAMSGNTTNFNVLTEFASGSLKRLRMAITGREVA